MKTDRRPRYRSPTSAELRRSRMVWLLRLEWAGVSYYLSSETVDVVTLDGVSLSFVGAFEPPDVREQINQFQTSLSSLSVPLDVYFEDVDVARRVFRDRALLSACRGELSIVLVDNGSGQVLQTYEQRFLQLVGHVERPQIGHPARAPGWARFSLEQRPYDDPSTVVPSTARILSSTHDHFEDESRGAVYPLVFGVGLGWDGSTVYPGSPAYRLKWSVTERYLLICMGRVEASSVTVIDSAGASSVRTVSHATDKLGQVYARVNVSGSGLSGTEFWISWYDGSGPVGALGRVDLDGAISTAGDVLAWLWSLSPDGADLVSWVGVSAALSRYAVAGFINDPDITVWAWVKTKILPLLPVVVVPRPAGVAPVYLDARSDRGAVATIEEGAHFRRITSWTASRSARDFSNVVTLEYRHDPQSGRYRAVARLGSGAQDDEQPTLHAINSEQQFGRRIEQLLTSEYISDATTAALIVDEQLQRRSWQQYEADFEASADWGTLQPGDSVRLTEAGSLTEQRAWVLGRVALDGVWLFRLLLLVDPVVDVRT